MKRLVALSLPCLLLLTGCSSAELSAQADAVSAPEAAAMPAAAGYAGRAHRRARINSASPAQKSYSFEQDPARKMSYTTTLSVTVPDTVAAVRTAAGIATKFNGYTVFSDNNSARLKLPVAKAAAALMEIEKLGTVTSRIIRAQDVTERYVDVQVRLDNLRKLQKRLSELCKQAKKVEEILKIERELSRVTSELERYQAQMNNLNNRVQMVDVTVNFSAPSAIRPTPRAIVPVAWISKLGIDITSDRFKRSDEVDDSPAKISLPEGFVTTSGTEYTLKAVNAEDIVLRFNKFINLKGGTLAYYKSLIAKQLKYVGFEKITVTEDKVDGDTACLVITSSRAGQSYNLVVVIYDDGLICKDERVYLLEVYGRSAEVKKLDFAGLYRSIRF